MEARKMSNQKRIICQKQKVKIRNVANNYKKAIVMLCFAISGASSQLIYYYKKYELINPRNWDKTSTV